MQAAVVVVVVVVVVVAVLRKFCSRPVLIMVGRVERVVDMEETDRRRRKRKRKCRQR